MKQNIEKENEILIECLGIANKYVNKYHKTLQEIKAIAGNIIIAYTDIAKSNEKLKAFDLRNRLQQILQKITKAEEE